MRTYLRRALIGSLTLFLLGLTLVTDQGSQAEAASIVDYSKQLTKGQKADLAAANAMRKKAVNKSHSSLNYKVADKYDRGRTKARRKFAAGFLASGGTITKISKAELKKVKKYLPKKKRSSYYGKGVQGFAPKRCTGVTKSVDVPVKGPAFDVRTYFNSCDTDFIVDATDSIAIAMGIVAALFPPSAPVTGAAAGIVLISKTVISHQQNRSDLNAIYIRDYTHILTVHPQ